LSTAHPNPALVIPIKVHLRGSTEVNLESYLRQMALIEIYVKDRETNAKG
jgi:hypothetical protein